MDSNSQPHRDFNQAEIEPSVVSSERSRHSSIRGPYRKGLKTGSFAVYNLSSTIPGQPESYTRSLTFAGHGYPPWEAVGDIGRPANHLRGGVGIGDVGVTMAKGGQFFFHFNIFNDEDDPIQHRGTPAKFKPLRPALDSTEVRFEPEYFPPGTVISSRGVEVKHISESPVELSLTSSAREGGFLFLEHGASRQDLISTKRVRAYVKEHALDIYRYLNEYEFRGINIPNGSLYVVTGCDKAPSFRMAYFPNESRLAGKKVSISYKNGRWGNAEGISTQGCDPTPEIEQSAVFLRGVRVALSEKLWAQHLAVEPIGGLPYSNILTSPILGFRSKILARWDWIRNPAWLPKLRDRRRAFHPSTILLEILLLVAPQAQIAMVEDSVWQSVADGCEGTLPQIKRLIKEILRTHEIQTDDGVVSLVPLMPEARRTPRSFKEKLFASVWKSRMTPEELAYNKLSGFFSSRLTKPL